MNWFERACEHFGYKFLKVREGTVPRAFVRKFKKDLAALKRLPGNKFEVREEMRYNAGTHPENYRDMECRFAAGHLSRIAPRAILDVGSYRQFVTGLLAAYRVTTLDVRSRRPVSANEHVVTGDAKKIPLPDDTFDAVVSLCALEHIGLGRYGDEVDFVADWAALAEMRRVLKPGGRLIFTTTITQAQPVLLFNTHRIYTLGMLREMCFGLKCEEEKFFNHRTDDFCDYRDVTRKPGEWNVYCGCWIKE